MSSRKRMSLGGLRGRASPTVSESGGRESESKSGRRTSIGAWAVGIGGALKTSVQRASAAADRFERRLFAEYDDEPGEIGIDGDAYGMLCAQRGQGQRVQFESRYRHFVETLGDLSLAADVDPEGAAAQLNDSRATEDLDAMLALLTAEERQNSRAEHSRTNSRVDGDGTTAGGGGGGGGGDLLAAPCLEFLLEARVVKLLCEMGSADRPAGTMALVLGAVASLLSQVGHPLLPSKAVHDPIAKLVAAAGGQVRWLEGAGGREGGAPAGVRANLARLLGEIWRKLREESALLDFFLAADGNGDVRLDMFDRLLPLLELRGGAGQQAQEACLVALSVKDARVGRYVRDRTGLASQLAETLTARYMALYDTLEELQVAAALPPPPPPGGGKDAAGARGVAGLLTQQQPERAEATFTEALTLFLQHLRFCNAVGLVAADTQACLRPPSTMTVSSPGGGCAGTAEQTAIASDVASSAADADEDGLAGRLASQVRSLLLSHAVGPALTSALESRARWTTTIVARTLTELSAGVEGYGVAVAGLAASAGDAGGGRRQLGPLVETVSAFLVGREGSGRGGGGATPGSSSPVSSLPTSPAKRGESAAPASTSSSMVLMTSRRSSNVCLRDVLLRRLDSSSPSQLRISTLELLASLAELRDDRVLLDLVLCPGSGSGLERPRSESSAAASGGEGVRRGPESGDGGGGARDDLEALLNASPGGALEGLRVSRSMVDSFGSAFGGSPIHPSFRLFSASSHLSLEGYLVAAHQRQIHQLMEGARGGLGGQGQGGSDADADMVNIVVGSDGGKVLQAVAAVAAAAAAGAEGEEGGVEAAAAPAPAPAAAAPTSATSGGSSSSSILSGIGGAGVDGFDATGFTREHGDKLASASGGSFLSALFDCLEAVFERTLEENLAVTGVLSSLCLAATAAEVSPVRRLLLVLLFDGTQDAPFRSMRRILEKLWASAKERVASLPDAPRQLARARASLGMPSVGDPGDSEDVKGAPGTGGGEGRGGGRQGSRGMREELSNSKRRQQQQQQQQPTDVSRGEGGVVDGPAGVGAEDTLAGERGSTSTSSEQQQQHEQQQEGLPSPAHFLGTYVFLEEFLKELFCALSAKNGVETDAQGLSESHQGSAELLRTRLLSVDGDSSPKPASSAGPGRGGGDRGFGAPGAAGDGDDKEEERELPTSLDEFLRQAAFPTFVSPPLQY